MTFSSISNLWNKWNIRGIVILSLSLQVFLILCAPLRKKIAKSHVVFLLWLTYLMANWVATFGIGLISHSQGNSCTRATGVDEALHAFLALFLLLHLGGPDTITAFSLEDSSLWRRHLLDLIFQVGVAIYVFWQIFPSDKSLVIPTMMVFLAGLIKNAERTLALNLSSLPRLREWMIISNEVRTDACSKLAEELKVLENGYSEEEEAKIDESIVVKHAYYFFQIFQVCLADLIFSNEERLLSREYFCKVFAMNALRVISVELQFMYEVLCTKVLAIRSKWSYIFRFTAFTEVAMALVLFNRFKSHQLPELDVEITFILLYGGIALDVIALFMVIFSDWTVVGIMHYKTRSSKLNSFLHELVSATDDLRKPICEVEPNANAMYAVLDTPFIFRRWSESIYACNLFSEFCKRSSRKMYKRDQHSGIITFSNICSFSVHVAEKINSCYHQARGIITGRKLSIIVTPRYVSKNPFIKKLWIFIFNEVRRKSRDVHNPTEARKMFEARGDMFLQSRPEGIHCGNLIENVTKTTYHSSIIMWHIATEIWYNIEIPTKRNDEREFSKILSDYMLYLLLNQPDVVSAVAGFAQITAANILFLLENISDAKDVEELCKTLYEDTFIQIMLAKTLLCQGIELAQKMRSLEERKWMVMSGVWVEMLSYAAGHIKGEAHMQVLSEGGELLAFVWLLIAHFGCLYKPEWGVYGEYVFGTE
ncbi:uncharacterized protein LOC115689720 [Syzygium oleosum]|uniref:uncharacterized protein LOC115689720 n=1 Tax=Syzygium oleosum TaxID=219896 RepID=UPI0024B9975D|nr:uncharacterized protein LOC115689720 [Syzygium oleosum]